jgi:hypothetical protein
MLGIGVIAVAAPIATAFYPGIAVVVGAIAAVWVFFARTLFFTIERRQSAKAAEIQEQFDLLLFAMPQLAPRDPSATPEEISDLTGDDQTTLASVKRESLKNWYPIHADIDGKYAIAIAQRGNAAYSERLLRFNANLWLGITVIWSAIALAIGLILGLSTGQFLLGVVLPLLPALLDVWEQWRQIASASREQRALCDRIDKSIREEGQGSFSGEDLLLWQSQLYTLRRNAPHVLNAVYRKLRQKNELAMNSAAASLAEVARLHTSKPSGGTSR